MTSLTTLLFRRFINKCHPPKGTRTTNIQVSGTDAIHIYCTKRELWIQLRRDVPTLKDIGETSFKAAMKLAPEQAVELAKELLTAASYQGKAAQNAKTKIPKADAASPHAAAPLNQGKPWTEPEVGRLAADFDAGISVPDLAAKHQRSIGAVEARLSKLGKIGPEMFTVYKPTPKHKKAEDSG